MYYAIWEVWLEGIDSEVFGYTFGRLFNCSVSFDIYYLCYFFKLSMVDKSCWSIVDKSYWFYAFKFSIVVESYWFWCYIWLILVANFSFIASIGYSFYSSLTGSLVALPLRALSCAKNPLIYFLKSSEFCLTAVKSSYSFLMVSESLLLSSRSVFLYVSSRFLYCESWLICYWLCWFYCCCSWVSSGGISILA